LLFHDVYQHTPAESGFSSEVAHRYKLRLRDFDAQLAAVAEARHDSPIRAQELLPTGGSVGAAESTPGTPPYLVTVDDGGVSYYTVIADRLEQYGWRGHCFVSTDRIGTRGFLDARQIRELDARGHVIGSHSASHPPRFSACSPAQMRDEWADSRRVLEDIVGHDVDVASVPGGYFSKAVAKAAADAGIRILFTSEPVTSLDRCDGCLIAGRFTIRSGDASDASRQLVAMSGWARSRAWLDWNAKGLVKPILGPVYIRFSEWLAAH
jgi:peptidoglycan/xylan/chitin deacetylase (PgdA/CDA1 family)